ncbi:MAG: UDP-N-acetylmuramoyl-L-alanyl-D-glutamate--2,6-diaminopimelate ligase [Planctomycetota bacterium]|jgi:UDP-N-acetylmuramoyl-L-alanyl-D-glutamate--2,6-diaminopimelate ligase
MKKTCTVETIREVIDVQEIVGNYKGMITGLSLDSRDEMIPGWLFFVVSGETFDGHDFIDAAIEKGASVIVCERIPEKRAEGVAYIRVSTVRKAMSLVAVVFHDYPSRTLEIVGITGTNGKTTIATLLFNLYQSMGYKVGLISTIENRIHDRILPTRFTTPETLKLQQLFAGMRDEGCQYCFMEVSSHALSMGRVADIDFDIAIFTNLTQDHLDYHDTMEDYATEKKKLFDGLGGDATAIINSDDQMSEYMTSDTDAKIITYGIDTEADHKGVIQIFSLQGTEIELGGVSLHSPLVGRFNVHNILAIYATAVIHLGVEKSDEIMSHLEMIERPRGRFEVVEFSTGKVGVVDYAHTPDAMEKVLETAREVVGEGKLWVILGAGGDRDPGKRPQMGEIAARLADHVIITTDNPRGEDPQKIIDDILAGIPGERRGNVEIIADRHGAITAGKSSVQSGDLLLVLGKGHETYQEIEGVRHHFDDREELLRV